MGTYFNEEMENMERGDLDRLTDVMVAAAADDDLLQPS